MIIHPQSFRALAYEIQNHLTSSTATDDTPIPLPLIEQEIRNKFASAQKKLDIQREKQGGEPEPYRITTLTRTLSGHELRQTVTVPNLLTFGGMIWISFLGPVESDRGFVPADHVWQLAALVARDKRPAYAPQGTTIHIRLTPETVLIPEIKIICALADYFPTDDRSHPWFWETAWNVPGELKDQVKMDAISVFMNTHIQLNKSRDVKNNGTDQ